MEKQSTLVMQPVQWSGLKDIDDVKPLGEDDRQLLTELRQVLLQHNAVDRFGISLIHKHFDLADGEELVEFTDTEKRVLTIKPVTKSTILKTIETSWKFSAESGNGEPLTVCSNKCWVDSYNRHSYGH